MARFLKIKDQILSTISNGTGRFKEAGVNNKSVCDSGKETLFM